MRIALVSDIHANLPALEAVFEAIDRQQPDALYCLGDLVGYNIWPNEVIALIRERRIPTIMGNYDQGVGNNSDDCGCAYKTEEDKAMGAVSISLSNQWIDASARAYLHDLPAHLRLTYEHTTSPTLQLLLVHGSPRKVNEYLFEDRAERSMLRMMADAQADILCFGHTHKPYHRAFLDPETQRYRHAINTGSVGKPKDGDPRACYVMLHLDPGADWRQPDALKVEFIRVPYDLERAAQAIEQSPLPAAYADMLRKAY